jgi:alanine-synthesizing transaminase
VFSSRLPGSLAPNRISVAVEAARARGPLLDLTESNPTVVGLRYPVTTIAAALAHPDALTYAPSAEGQAGARQAVAAYYARHGQAVDSADIVLSASTSESYAWLFKLLCDAGDEVLVPTPSYPLFEHLAALECVRPLSYPLRYHGGWFLDVEEVRRALTPRTRAIVVVNPNNPTGSFLTRDELAGLQALAATHELALISDEVFADYGEPPRAAAAAGAERVPTLAGASGALTFCLSGLSKPVGLPQLKLGWIVVGGPPRLRAAAEERLHLIADTFLSVATPVQLAAPQLLALVDDVGAQIGERVRRNRALLGRALAGTSAQLLRADGGWSAIIKLPSVPHESEEAWVLALLERGLLVHPGFFFDLPPTCIVVSLLVEEARLAAAVAVLVAQLE